MDWNGKHVLVTGGASFIGSHLVDALVARGARVTIVDDLSSGRLENIQGHLGSGKVEFIKADLRHAMRQVPGAHDMMDMPGHSTSHMHDHSHSH